MDGIVNTTMLLTAMFVPLAFAMDVTLTISPAPGGLQTEALQCTVTDVKKGELLALPAQTIAGSEVVPMIEIGSVGPWGVRWQSALRSTTSRQRCISWADLHRATRAHGRVSGTMSDRLGLCP